jgi:hypothetical protein
MCPTPITTMSQPAHLIMLRQAARSGTAAVRRARLRLCERRRDRTQLATLMSGGVHVSTTSSACSNRTATASPSCARPSAVSCPNPRTPRWPMSSSPGGRLRAALSHRPTSPPGRAPTRRPDQRAPIHMDLRPAARRPRRRTPRASLTPAATPPADRVAPPGSRRPSRPPHGRRRLAGIAPGGATARNGWIDVGTGTRSGTDGTTVTDPVAAVASVLTFPFSAELAVVQSDDRPVTRPVRRSIDSARTGRNAS